MEATNNTQQAAQPNAPQSQPKQHATIFHQMLHGIQTVNENVVVTSEDIHQMMEMVRTLNNNVLALIAAVTIPPIESEEPNASGEEDSAKLQ